MYSTVKNKSIKKIHLAMVSLCIFILCIFVFFSPFSLEWAMERGISPEEFSSFGHFQFLMGLVLGSIFGVGIAAIRTTMSKSST